jgi:Ni2+-binding GTPase involved in maturation of urease and hydrogenase
MGALETLQGKFGCQLLFVESGGDNLAANYSRELADYIIYVIDVSVRGLFTRLATIPTMRPAGR